MADVKGDSMTEVNIELARLCAEILEKLNVVREISSRHGSREADSTGKRVEDYGKDFEALYRKIAAVAIQPSPE